nr:TonB-dependent receptor [Hansschlegelia beijingensis]
MGLRRSAALLGTVSLATLASLGPVLAQDVGATALEEIDVIGTTPLGGDDLDRDKVPASVTTLTQSDFSNISQSSISEAIARRAPSVNLSDVQGNPYFKDFYFRGFVASPLNGIPQGIAVYQNGVRQNEAFGDTVNFDLIPEVAVDRVDIWTNNPVFGLNALGGALNIKMKNGFTYQGLETEFLAGSFGKFSGNAQWGQQFGNWATYLALEGERDGGWRDYSKSDVKRVYGDVGYKGDAAEIHLNFSLADTNLGVVGPTPRELLERGGRKSVYTGPQTTDNQAAQLNLTGDFDLGNSWGLQTNVYYRRFKQKHVDGNDTDVRPCEDNPALLCLEADDIIDPETGQNPDEDDPRLIVRDRNGNPIATPAGFAARPGSIERSRTKNQTVGGTAQVTNTGQLFGKTNHFVAGVSYDHGWSDFSGYSELGIIPDNLQVIGTGDIYHTTIPGGILPSDVKTWNNYLGLYVSDTLDLTDRLSATLGARLNYAHIKLRDKGQFFNVDLNGNPAGAGLDGSHNFTRFNPMAGLTYKITPEMTAYAGYSESNRAPTPLELGCADPSNPCQLEGFLVSDPPLKQVVTRTGEIGLRGRTSNFGGVMNWKIGGYFAQNHNDILTVPSPLTGRGYFINGGNTRRAGVELSADYQTETWGLYANYSYIDATFRKNMILGSPNSPSADGRGEIRVRKGDKLPGIPEHQFKAGFAFKPLPKLTLGADVVAMSSQYFVGDESNQEKKLKGYVVFNANASYQVTDQIRVFGLVDNVFNNKYATYGTFYDNDDIEFLNLRGSRSITPARPRGFYGGIAYKFTADATPVLTTKD